MVRRLCHLCKWASLLGSIEKGNTASFQATDVGEAVNRLSATYINQQVKKKKRRLQVFKSPYTGKVSPAALVQVPSSSWLANLDCSSQNILEGYLRPDKPGKRRQQRLPAGTFRRTTKARGLSRTVPSCWGQRPLTYPPIGCKNSTLPAPFLPDLTDVIASKPSSQQRLFPWNRPTPAICTCRQLDHILHNIYTLFFFCRSV